LEYEIYEPEGSGGEEKQSSRLRDMDHAVCLTLITIRTISPYPKNAIFMRSRV
jgi:hypothetical protein